MLKEILSVSGKSGLFKLISKGKNMFIVESLIDNKRIPVYMKDKVVSLGDISIYTEEEEVSLSVILNSIKEKENCQPIQFSTSIKPEELRTYFETVLPAFDRDRVYPSDIKKIMLWYNLLVKKGLTDFIETTADPSHTEITENEEKTDKE
jgi:hypothetical protein